MNPYVAVTWTRDVFWPMINNPPLPPHLLPFHVPRHGPFVWFSTTSLRLGPALPYCPRTSARSRSSASIRGLERRRGPGDDGRDSRSTRSSFRSLVEGRTISSSLLSFRRLALIMRDRRNTYVARPFSLPWCAKLQRSLHCPSSRLFSSRRNDSRNLREVAWHLLPTRGRPALSARDLRPRSSQ